MGRNAALPLLLRSCVLSHPLPVIKRGLTLRAAFLDQKSAFKTIPTSQPCLTIIAVWDPDASGIRYYYHPGHPFGLTAAVINFAQHPEIVVAAVREICGVPADHYVDDYMLVDWHVGGHSAQRCLEGIIDALGDGGGAGNRAARNASTRRRQSRWRPVTSGWG